MSVDTSDRKVTYTCSAVAAYDFTFRALTSAPTDIKCVLTLVATGAETDLTYTTDYTAAINSNGVGGKVTLVTTYGTTYLLTIYRDTTDLQSSDYNDYNQFPADTLENDLDRRTMKSQEIVESIDRTVKLPISSTASSLTLPNPSANKYLLWNGTADGLVNGTGTPSETTVRHIRATITSPADFFTNVDTKLCLVPKLGSAITISRVDVSCDSDPTTEITGDLKYANALIGTASSTVIRAIDTAGGTLSTTTITTPSVAAGKCIYLQFDTTPDAALKQLAIDMQFTYD